MAAVGASDALQGGGMVVDAFQGISSEGFNLLKTGAELLNPKWGGVVYESASLGFNLGALSAKVPLIVGASDGINRVKSMFGFTVTRWNNSRAILGTVYSRPENRAILVGSAVKQAHSVRTEVNEVRERP